MAQSNDEVRVIEESVELYNNKKKEQNKRLKVPFLFCAIRVILSVYAMASYFDLFSAGRNIQKATQHIREESRS